MVKNNEWIKHSVPSLLWKILYSKWPTFHYSFFDKLPSKGTDYQKWMRTENDSDNFFALRNLQGSDHFLYANKLGMSVKRALTSNDMTTPKPPIVDPTPKPSPEPPTGGADFKMIKISASFIQLLLLAELLMM